MIANLLIKLAKRREKLLLLREQGFLKQAKKLPQKSFVIESLVGQLSTKGLEMKSMKKDFHNLVDKCKEDLRSFRTIN